MEEGRRTRRGGLRKDASKEPSSEQFEAAALAALDSIDSCPPSMLESRPLPEPNSTASRADSQSSRADAPPVWLERQTRSRLDGASAEQGSTSTAQPPTAPSLFVATSADSSLRPVTTDRTRRRLLECASPTQVRFCWVERR